MMGEVKKRYATLRRIGIEHTGWCESHYIWARRSTYCSTWIRGVSVRISGGRRICIERRISSGCVGEYRLGWAKRRNLSVVTISTFALAVRHGSQSLSISAR